MVIQRRVVVPSMQPARTAPVQTTRTAPTQPTRTVPTRAEPVRSGGRVVSQGTMLELLLPSRVRRKVMALFLVNPEERLHIREIERRTDEDFQGVRRELNRLERAGLLRSKRVSNLKFYSLNKDFYLYPELRSIVVKSERAGEGIIR